jgi:pimeloyl-ACP methyl ester carboxylesterase
MHSLPGGPEHWGNCWKSSVEHFDGHDEFEFGVLLELLAIAASNRSETAQGVARDMYPERTVERRTVVKSLAMGSLMVAATGRMAVAQSNTGPKQRHFGPFIDSGDGTKLFVHDWGDGMPIVFCHPWALNADIWEYQLTELSEQGLRCIAYDRRGHGRSEDPGRGYDYDTLAADLAAVIEQLDLRNVTLVGYSMGSGEIARYMSRHGADRVARVVLVSPVAPATESRAMSDNFIAALKKDRPAFMAGGIPLFLGKDSLVSPAMTQWVLDQFLRSSPKAIIECTRSVAAGDHRPHLSAMTMPTLIIQGDKDEICPLELTGRKLVEAIPGSQLRVYQGAPHGIVLTHRDRFTQDLLSFVRS